MTLTLTSNDHRSIFVYLNGEQVADITTFRRQRGLWCRTTKQYTEAADCTPRKLRREPARILGPLAMAGLDLPSDVSFNVDGLI